jgi:hypothetical protein
MTCVERLLYVSVDITLKYEYFKNKRQNNEGDTNTHLLCDNGGKYDLYVRCICDGNVKS